jgi:hypothetical protein
VLRKVIYTQKASGTQRLRSAFHLKQKLGFNPFKDGGTGRTYGTVPYRVQAEIVQRVPEI